MHRAQPPREAMKASPTGRGHQPARVCPPAVVAVASGAMGAIGSLGGGGEARVHGGELGWRRPLATALDVVIATYQRWISPLLPPSCRFEPSCSRYAREALRRHRITKAVVLIIWRLARCQPLCAGGHDPVPPGPWDLPSESSTESAADASA
jgi:putative membrane protein insertion efficiency factor